MKLFTELKNKLPNYFGNVPIGVLTLNSNKQIFIKLKKAPLYDDYYLTDWGIFRFILKGYYGFSKTPLLISQNYILPKELI